MRLLKHKVKREFHPVGQGAFYSETFTNASDKEETFRMVFDCGNDLKHNDNKVSVDDYVKKELKGEIDLLFISHFHKDHIRYLVKYKGHYKVKNVVIPTINDHEISLLLLGFKLEKSDINYNSYIQLVKEPGDFFKRAKIIRIGSNEDDIPENVLKTSNKSYKLTYEKECFSLSYHGKPIWQYIPYNFINSNNDAYKKFSDHFEEIGLTEKEPIEYVKDICNNEIGRISFEDLTSIYKEIYSDLNKLCIGVLSLPTKSVYNFLCLHHDYYHYCHHYHHHCCHHGCYHYQYFFSCLYTGDMPFESEHISKIKKIISGNKFSKDVSIDTVQIPHHGSGGKYFDESFFELNFKNAVMCFGSKNKYDHPSKDLLITLALKEKNIKIITEDNKTKLLYEFIFDV